MSSIFRFFNRCRSRNNGHSHYTGGLLLKFDTRFFTTYPSVSLVTTIAPVAHVAPVTQEEHIIIDESSSNLF